MIFTGCDRGDVVWFGLVLGYKEAKSSAFRHAEFEMMVEHQSKNVHQEVKNRLTVHVGNTNLGVVSREVVVDAMAAAKIFNIEYVPGEEQVKNRIMWNI